VWRLPIDSIGSTRDRRQHALPFDPWSGWGLQSWLDWLWLTVMSGLVQFVAAADDACPQLLCRVSGAMMQCGIEQKMLQDNAKFKTGENLVLSPLLSSCQHDQSTSVLSSKSSSNCSSSLWRCSNAVRQKSEHFIKTVTVHSAPSMEKANKVKS